MAKVTPCVGVWIEIVSRGLKCILLFVTPCVGVWIEILTAAACCRAFGCHSLRGSVD